MLKAPLLVVKGRLLVVKGRLLVVKGPFLTMGARLAVVCLLLAVALPAVAQQVPHDLVEGGAGWVAGDFAEAYALAVAQDTAAAQLLASRAAADQAVYLSGEDAAAVQRWLASAEAAATRALELAPRGPYAADAHLAWARARGETALRSGLLDNLSVASELKRAFEAALELRPDNPGALVAYGMWHLELTQRGVGWLYGGRRDQVLPLLERGLSLAPARIDLLLEYATALRALGLEDRAQEQLRFALAQPALTAADAFELARARTMLR